MAKSKKTQTRKLTKNQLKKLKGGLIVCQATGCPLTWDSCQPGKGTSEEQCGNTDHNTVNIQDSGKGTLPTKK